MIPMDRLPLDTVRDIVRMIMSVSAAAHEHRALTTALLEGLADIVKSHRMLYAVSRKPASGGPPQWSSVLDIRRESHEPTAKDQWLCVHSPETESNKIMFNTLCRVPFSHLSGDGRPIQRAAVGPKLFHRPPHSMASKCSDTKFTPHPGTAPAISHSIGACRAVGQPPFSGRELAILNLFLAELARQDAAASGLSVQKKLPPRLQRVLPLLQQGTGIMEISEILDLSRFTVQEYVQDIYRRFKVCTRRELQAILAQQPSIELPPMVTKVPGKDGRTAALNIRTAEAAHDTEPHRDKLM